MAGRPRNFEADEVLERAMHLFWAKGYEATGIADLERATGLGRQSLYGAFGDKRALFEQVVEFYFDRVLKPGLIDRLDAPGSGRKNVEGVLDLWMHVALAPDFNGCLVGNGASAMPPGDPEMAELLRRKLKLMEDAFARALRRAQEAREVRPSLDPRSTARSLLAMSQGLAVIGRVQREPAFVRGVVEGARRLLD